MRIGGVPVSHETRVLTVPLQSVNDELAVRQAFGWHLAQTSSRSFATGGSFVGVGAEVGSGLVVGGGQVSLNSAHYTDLVLQRATGSRAEWLARLEQQYDAIAFKPDASYWIVVIFAAVIFGVGLFGGAAVTVSMGNGNDSVSPMLFLLPLITGIIVGILVRSAIQRRRIAANQEAERQQLQIIEHARTGGRTA